MNMNSSNYTVIYLFIDYYIISKLNDDDEYSMISTDGALVYQCYISDVSHSIGMWTLLLITSDRLEFAICRCVRLSLIFLSFVITLLHQCNTMLLMLMMI